MIATIKIKIASREHQLRMQYEAYKHYSHPSTAHVIEALKGSIQMLPKLEIFLNEHKN